MDKKTYQQPQATIVKIGLNDNIMDSISILTGSNTNEQYVRHHSSLWDDEDEEEDW